MRLLAIMAILFCGPANATFFLPYSEGSDLPPITEDDVKALKTSNLLERAIAHEICAEASRQFHYPEAEAWYRQNSLEFLHLFALQLLEDWKAERSQSELVAEFAADIGDFDDSRMIAGAVLVRIKQFAAKTVGDQGDSLKALEIPYPVERLLHLRDLPLVFNCDRLEGIDRQ